MLLLDKKLTSGDYGSTAPSITHKGQAHFADTSISGQCGICEHHVRKDENALDRRYFCREAAAMKGDWSSAVPKKAQACKYFLRDPSKSMKSMKRKRKNIAAQDAAPAE